MQIRFVIFDLSGTLIDKHNVLEGVEENFNIPFLQKNGINIKLEDFKKAREDTDREIVLGKIQYDISIWTKILCSKLGIPYSKKLSEEWESEFRKYMDSRLKLMEGAKEILEHLKNKNYRLVLFTNSTRKKAEIKLEKFGIVEYFEFVFVSEEVGVKSSIQSFKTVLENIGAKAEECIMVGNQMDEDIFAKRVGMKTVLLEDSRQKYFKETEEPDFKVKKLAELKEIL